MATAILKCRVLTTPVSGRDRDLLRYVAAVPNMDGRNPDGTSRPIFTGQYFIAESSDIPLEEFSTQYFDSFKDRLAFLGYTNLEIVD